MHKNDKAPLVIQKRLSFASAAIYGIMSLFAVSGHAQMSIGAYAGQPGITPNTSATASNVCAASIPLDGNTSTKLLGANTGDGCAPSQLLVSKPNAVQIDSYGQIYISDGGNYNSNVETSDSATYTTPTLANSYVGVTPGPGYTGELRVLYNGTNTALGTALINNYNSASILNSPVPANVVYNVIGGGEFSGYGTGGSDGYTTIFASADVAVDAPGNIYEQASNFVRMTYVAGTQQASFLAAGSSSSAAPVGSATLTPGNSYVLIDENTPGEGYFGDGGYVLLSQFNGPRGMAVDANGNLYVADSSNNVVREINIAGATTDALGNTTQLGYVTGVVGGAGTGCAEATVSKGTYTSCTAVESGDDGAARYANLAKPYDLAFDSYGNLYVADYGSGAGRVRVVYLGKQPPAGFYATAATSCTGTASTATTGTLATCKDIYTYAGGGTSTTAAAATSIKLSSASGIGFDAANDLYIVDTLANQIWEVAAATQNATIVAGGGTSTTQSACSSDGYGDGCIATSAVLSAPTGHIAVDNSGYVYFGDSGNNVVRILKPYRQGTTAQTITFPAPTSPVAYGAASITLDATASSALPVSYTVTGPATMNGSTLTFTGTGTVVISATQAGNAVYAAATAVQQSIVVNNATLTVSVSGSPSRIFGTANPVFGYTITGFISPDTQAGTITGAPVITTTAVPKSPAGSYPIVISLNSLAVSNTSHNYAIALSTAGTLAVTGSAAQSLAFLPLANYVNNGNTIQMVASTTSGLPATFSVTSGAASISGNTLYLFGNGAVSITASQPGNASFAAATSVTQAIHAQATTFPVFDSTFYNPGKPSTTQYGLIPGNVVYESLIWPDPNGTTQTDEETLPTRSSFDTLMANYTNAGPIVLDVELLGLTSSADETILATLAQWAEADHPGNLVGYYGYNTLDNVPSKYNTYAKELAGVVTAMIPSLYTYDTTSGTPTSQTWLAEAQSEITAARTLAPTLPVYIYTSPQYHTTFTYMPEAQWASELQTALTYANGLVIWSPSGYAWDNTSGWWTATQSFMESLQ